MSIDRKSLASFRVLVAVARADGQLTAAERAVLRDALGSNADLLEALLHEEVSVDEELALLDDDERRRVYHSAFALTYADDKATVDEVNLLKKIVPNEGERTLLGQVFGEAADTLIPGRIVAEADPAQRDMEILEDILKYSVLAAVAGAMPVPGLGVVADLAVIALQAKMVNDIGAYWGHQLDRAQMSAFLGSVAGSAGMRIAVNNLARFVPGWGSAFGAATSFATTFALGKVAQVYFEGGRGLNEEQLKDLFANARSEAMERFDTEEQRIEEARRKHGEALAELNERLASGQLSRADYDHAVARLG